MSKYGQEYSGAEEGKGLLPLQGPYSSQAPSRQLQLCKRALHRLGQRPGSRSRTRSTSSTARGRRQRGRLSSSARGLVCRAEDRDRERSTRRDRKYQGTGKDYGGDDDLQHWITARLGRDAGWI